MGRVANKRWLGRAMLVALVTVATIGLTPVVAQAGGTSPSLTAVLEADQTDAISGEPVLYELTVTNTGNVPLTGLSISYSGTPDCDQTIDDLGIGEHEVVGCSYATSDAELGSFGNQATVSSNETDPVGSNTWIVVVNATVDSLSVSLGADETTVAPGDTIHYHAAVENTGNIAAFNVRLSIPTIPGCGVAPRTLTVGEDFTLDCEYETTAADLGTVSHVAVAGSDQVIDIESTPVSVTVRKIRRPGPDVTVRRPGGPRIGNNIYDTFQHAVARRRPGGQATFFVEIQNDGEVAESFRVRPTLPRARGSRDRYFLGDTGVEITRSMQAWTYRTPLIAPGASVTVRLEMTVREQALVGASPAVDLRAKSSNGDRPSDTVRAEVIVVD